MKINKIIRQNMLNILIWIVFVLLCVPSMWNNMKWSVTRQFLTMIFMTLGLTVEMISGVLDLSFAAEISAATCVGAALLGSGKSISTALAAMLLFHLAVGVVKGGIIGKLKVNPIIITLALQMILSNLAGIFTGDSLLFFKRTEVYADMGFWAIIAGLLAVISAVLFYCLKNTYYGKYIRMLGEDEETVESSGLPCTAIRIVDCMTASALFFVASVIILFITSAGGAANGKHYLYPVIAAACMGGVSFFNGRGEVPGAFAGTLSVVVLMHMMVLWGIQSVYENILIGILIISSIILNTFDAKN